MKIENKDNIYFTSDLHAFHKNIIKFDNRPFSSVEEMNEKLISNWNSVVGVDDIVFYLGDLSFTGFVPTKEFVNKLNGEIHFIMGNHDKYDMISKLNRFESISSLKDIYVRDETIGRNYQHIVMCHYPIASWNKCSHGTIHLHGHCHHNLHGSEIGNVLYKYKVLDVGCNGWNYYPISYNQIKKELNGRDNQIH